MSELAAIKHHIEESYKLIEDVKSRLFGGSENIYFARGILDILTSRLETIAELTYAAGIRILTIPEDVQFMAKLKESMENITVEEISQMYCNTHINLTEKISEVMKNMYEQGYDPETMEIESRPGDTPFSIQFIAVPKKD